MSKQLVSVEWLKAHLDDEDLILLDASNGFTNTATISGAQHFDIKNTFSDTTSTLPNTFPSTLQFEKESRKLGVNQDSHIIIFDNKGIFTSPRVWWMFTVMGHQKVSVLDGGLPEWLKHKLPIGNSKEIKRSEGNFTAMLSENSIKSFDQIVKNSETSECVLIDARSRGRFRGSDPEPRSHIKSGQIPKALNLPYTEVLENNKYKSQKDLKAIFDNLDLSDKPVIFSCGSGITACIILLAFSLVSNKKASVYDGSWTEWAERKQLFVE